MTVNIQKILIVFFGSVYILVNSGYSKQEDWNTKKRKNTKNLLK